MKSCCRKLCALFAQALVWTHHTSSHENMSSYTSQCYNHYANLFAAGFPFHLGVKYCSQHPAHCAWSNPMFQSATSNLQQWLKALTENYMQWIECGSCYICNIYEFIHIHRQFDTIDEEACKKRKCLLGNVGSVDVYIIVGVSYTTILISEVPRIHKHCKTCTFGSSS